MVEVNIAGNRFNYKRMAFGPNEWGFAKIVEWQGDASKLPKRVMENAAWWGIASHELSHAGLEKTKVHPKKGYPIPTHALAMQILRLGPSLVEGTDDDWRQPCIDFLNTLESGLAEEVNFKVIPEPPAKMTQADIDAKKETMFKLKWKSFVDIFGETEMYRAYVAGAAGRVKHTPKTRGTKTYKLDQLGSFF